MRKIKTLFICILLSTGIFAQITDASPYCDAGYSDDISPVARHISNVSFNTLSNESGTEQFAAPHYVYYNNIQATEVIQNSSYDLIIAHDGGVTIHGIAAWIDFNQDGDFDDAGEKVGESNFPSSDPITYTIMIPDDAVIGTTRMRIRIFEDDYFSFSGNTDIVPCLWDDNGTPTEYDWGETEDYDINIQNTNSITTISKATFVSVYPIPAVNMLTIQLDNNETIKDVEVLSIDGKTVSINPIVNNQIDVSTLESGVYFLRIEDSKKNISTKRFVKE